MKNILFFLGFILIAFSACEKDEIINVKDNASIENIENNDTVYIEVSSSSYDGNWREIVSLYDSNYIEKKFYLGYKNPEIMKHKMQYKDIYLTFYDHNLTENSNHVMSIRYKNQMLSCNFQLDICQHLGVFKKFQLNITDKKIKIIEFIYDNCEFKTKEYESN